MAHVIIPDPSLVILCGPAGSGKSTFARRHFPQTVIVSSDHCRAMIGDDEANIAVSPDAFAIFHQIIEARLRHPRLTVADSTALQRHARHALAQIGRRWGVPVLLVVFDVPEETCVQWDSRRARRVGRSVIHRHCLALQQALREVADEGYAQVVMLSEDDIAKTSVELVRRPAEGVVERG